MHAGMLKMIVAQELLDRPCSGYTLAKAIEKKCKWKPSWGSIYPLLDKLVADGLASVHMEGRKKIYTLNEIGKRTLQQRQAARGRAFRSIVEQMRVLASLGDEEAAHMAAIMERVSQGDMPFQGIPEAIMVRGEMFRLMQQGKTETKNKQVRAVLRRTVRELKSL